MKMNSPTMNAKILPSKTAPAAMSFTCLIFALNSSVYTSANSSILVLIASKANTIVLAMNNHNHSNLFKPSINPATKTSKKMTNWIRAFLLSKNSSRMPIMAIFSAEKKFVCFIVLKLVKKIKMT